MGFSLPVGTDCQPLMYKSEFWKQPSSSLDRFNCSNTYNQSVSFTKFPPRQRSGDELTFPNEDVIGENEEIERSFEEIRASD